VLADVPVKAFGIIGNSLFFGFEDIFGADVEKIFDQFEITADAFLNSEHIEPPVVPGDMAVYLSLCQLVFLGVDIASARTSV